MGPRTGDPLAAKRIEGWFPNLRDTAYAIKSESAADYNCIAWAAGDTERWWWPDRNAYWPVGTPREETIEAFVQAYGTLRFVPCDNDELEPEFEKVAIFADSMGKPKHAARQLRDGKWTSKLGPWEDIEHTLMGLTGSGYGSVVKILKRPIQKWEPRRKLCLE